MLLIQRTDRINEDQKDYRGTRPVHIAKRPANRDQRQMNQVRIKRRTTDRTDDRNAENTAKEALRSRNANNQTAVDHDRYRVMANEVPRHGIRLHREETYIQNNE